MEDLFLCWSLLAFLCDLFCLIDSYLILFYSVLMRHRMTNNTAKTTEVIEYTTRKEKHVAWPPVRSQSDLKLSLSHHSEAWVDYK